MLASQNLLAEEVLDKACDIVTQLWRENRCSQNVEDDLTVEAKAIVRSFRACAEHGLWHERMAVVSYNDWCDLVAHARTFALAHNDVVKDPKALASVVGQFAVFFRDRMCDTSEAPDILPKAALHISMAVLSIIKMHQEVEAVRWAAEETAKNGYSASDCTRVALDAASWMPCDVPEVTLNRLERAGLSQDMMWVKTQCVKMPAVFYACIVPQITRDTVWLDEIKKASSEETSLHDRLDAWFCASRRFPMADQLALVSHMHKEARDAWLDRMMAVSVFHDCPKDRILPRMAALASLENAVIWLLTGQYAELDAFDVHALPMDLMPVWHVIRAFAAMRRGLPWEDALLRQSLCMPPKLWFWPALCSLYFALRTYAYCKQDAPRLALDELQTALECDLYDEHICLAMAQAHTQCAHFGEARLWLERADEADGDALLLTMREQVREVLARKAYDAAVHAPSTDMSLLELAIEIGKGDVFVDAVVCWFDAGFEQFDWLAAMLDQHATERGLILEKWLQRDEMVRLDALYQLASELEARHNQASQRDAHILYALACTDNPDDAFERFSAILERWPDNARECEDALFWHVASRYMVLGIPMMAFDTMTRTLAGDFARDSAMGRRMFRFYLAHLPRTAMLSVQQILMECLGRETAVACLMRLKQPDVEGAQEGDAKPFELPLPDLLGAPLCWQILALAGNKLRPQVDASLPSKREIARTLMMRSREVMPEPPKAQWIHTKLGKASDAFDK